MLAAAEAAYASNVQMSAMIAASKILVVAHALQQYGNFVLFLPWHLDVCGLTVGFSFEMPLLKPNVAVAYCGHVEFGR